MFLCPSYNPLILRVATFYFSTYMYRLGYNNNPLIVRRGFGFNVALEIAPNTNYDTVQFALQGTALSTRAYRVARRCQCMHLFYVDMHDVCNMSAFVVYLAVFCILRTCELSIMVVILLFKSDYLSDICHLSLHRYLAYRSFIVHYASITFNFSLSRTVFNYMCAYRPVQQQKEKHPRGVGEPDPEGWVSGGRGEVGRARAEQGQGHRQL